MLVYIKFGHPIYTIYIILGRCFILECWYIKACNNSGKEGCGPACIKFQEIKYMLDNSGLPARAKGPIKIYDVPEDKEAYAFLHHVNDNIVKYVKEGNNLLIFSEECGNGKTTWAMKLLTKYIDQIWNGNRFRIRAYYINVSKLYEIFRENIGIQTDEWTTLKNLLLTVDLLVLDDIALTNVEDRFYNLLYNIIDDRYQNMKSTIYTSNIVPEDIMLKLGRRIYSRVVNGSDVVEFIAGDRRGVD